jgi:ribosomal protein L24E
MIIELRLGPHGDRDGIWTGAAIDADGRYVSLSGGVKKQMKKMILEDYWTPLEGSNDPNPDNLQLAGWPIRKKHSRSSEHLRLYICWFCDLEIPPGEGITVYRSEGKFIRQIACAHEEDCVLIHCRRVTPAEEWKILVADQLSQESVERAVKKLLRRGWYLGRWAKWFLANRDEWFWKELR